MTKIKGIMSVNQSDATTGESLKNILVVDDQIEILKLLYKHLQPQGFNCISCQTVQEAKELIQKHNFSIIICDWLLPGEDGLAFCKYIKSTPETSHIYFIMLTANTETFQKESALLNGVDDYITKPFQNQELISRINIAYRVCALQKIAFDQERNKAITQMGRSIAHEINNPLTGLIGFLQLTKSRLEKKDTLDEADIQKTITNLEKCLEQSHRIKSVIQNIHKLTQPKFKMHGSTQIVDFNSESDQKKTND